MLKLIIGIESIVIIMLLYIIIQKAKFDMELEDYEDFPATIIDRDWYYSAGKRHYYITCSYKYGAITLYGTKFYNGFIKNESVILRIKTIKNLKGDIVSINEKNALLIKTNLG